MIFGIRRFLEVIFVIYICVGVSTENDPTVEDKTDENGKSRKKRRGCKCVQRYMADVDKLIDAKLKEFKDVYLLPTLNDKKDSEAQRMRDALLRLSGDVAETKNALRIMTTNMESMLEDLSSTQKDYAKLSRQINRMSGAVANLTKYVDNMEQKLADRPQDITANENMDPDTSAEPKPMPRLYSAAFATGRRCSNFSAEASALKQAAETLIDHKELSEKQVLIFTDALAVLMALKNHHKNKLGAMADSLERLSQYFKESIVQWIPAHCDIPGNEEADRLAREGGMLQQSDTEITYNKAKAFIRAIYRAKWKKTTLVT